MRKSVLGILSRAIMLVVFLYANFANAQFAGLNMEITGTLSFVSDYTLQNGCRVLDFGVVLDSTSAQKYGLPENFEKESLGFYDKSCVSKTVNPYTVEVIAASRAINFRAQDLVVGTKLRVSGVNSQPNASVGVLIASDIDVDIGVKLKLDSNKLVENPYSRTTITQSMRLGIAEGSTASILNRKSALKVTFANSTSSILGYGYPRSYGFMLTSYRGSWSYKTLLAANPSGLVPSKVEYFVAKDASLATWDISQMARVFHSENTVDLCVLKGALICPAFDINGDKVMNLSDGSILWGFALNREWKVADIRSQMMSFFSQNNISQSGSRSLDQIIDHLLELESRGITDYFGDGSAVTMRERNLPFHWIVGRRNDLAYTPNTANSTRTSPEIVQQFLIDYKFIPNTYDIDLDGAVNIDDGMMILKSLFGYTGAAVTQGIDLSDAKRELSGFDSHLALIKSNGSLDVDGNGKSDALSDGMLIVRYLNGIRGEALIDGVVDPLGTRITAEKIELFLRSFIP